MKKPASALSVAVLILLLGATLGASSASAQATQLVQTAAGPNCHTYGCINTPLSDGEMFTWCHVTTGSGCTKLSFRGLDYFMTAHVGGFPIEAVDLSSTAYENNGFAVHTDFLCGRFGCGWKDGTLTLDKEYVGSGTYLYGWNGSVNVTSGTGQVGLVSGVPFDQTVTLVSSDPAILQVPVSVVIPNGSPDADFTITATAPTGTGQTLSVNVTATFPDGTVAVMTVTVQPVPAPTPPDSKLIRPSPPTAFIAQTMLCTDTGGVWWPVGKDGMCHIADKVKGVVLPYPQRVIAAQN